ncbi:MAG TPA: hypothetical protein DHV08_10980 [Rhodocyclaceae bacterium]|nr:hypothetical protein [Rhodocyclaceae bacterium]
MNSFAAVALKRTCGPAVARFAEIEIMRYLRMQRPLRRKAVTPRPADAPPDLRQEAGSEAREVPREQRTQTTTPRSR